MDYEYCKRRQKELEAMVFSSEENIEDIIKEYNEIHNILKSIARLEYYEKERANLIIQSTKHQH